MSPQQRRAYVETLRAVHDLATRLREARARLKQQAKRLTRAELDALWAEAGFPLHRTEAL